MKLIAGLGNPGKKYQNTPHNAGFITLDLFLKQDKLAAFEIKKKYNAEISVNKSGKDKFFLAKPLTFMNNSGQPINKILKYYKIKKKDLLIIHDDIDLPFGKIKISFDRSSGGHNGIESAIKELKSKKFYRLRIGVKPNFPLTKEKTADYLLSSLPKKHQQEFKATLDKAFKIINDFIQGEKPEKIMSLYN